MREEASPSRAYVILTLVVAMIAVSSAATLFKLSEAPPFVKAFYRLLYAALLIAPFAWARHADEFRALKLRDVLGLSGVGVILAIHFGTWITSLDYTTVAASLVLVTIHPLIVAGYGQLFMGERLGTTAWVGIGVALAGGMSIAVLDGSAGGHGLFGDALAFAGAVAFAAYLLSARAYRKRLSVLPYVTVVYAAASLTLLVFALVAGDPLGGWSGREHGLFLALAAVPMIFGHTLINWVVKFVPAAIVSTTILTEPLGGVLIAFIVLGELASVSVLAGGAVVLAGVFLVARRA